MCTYLASFQNNELFHTHFISQKCPYDLGHSLDYMNSVSIIHRLKQTR